MNLKTKQTKLNKFSNSQLNTYQACNGKHYLKYHERLVPRVQNPNYFLGLIVHKSMELFTRNSLTMEQAVKDAILIIDKNYEEQFGQHMYEVQENLDLIPLEFDALDIMKRYVKWNETQSQDGFPLNDNNFEIIASELELSVEIMPGYIVELFIDQVLRHKESGEYFLREFKTAKSIKSFRDNLAYDRQPFIYKKAVEQHLGEGIVVKGVIYDLFSKHIPKLKVTTKGDISHTHAQTTSPEAFLLLAREHYINELGYDEEILTDEIIISHHDEFYYFLVAQKAETHFIRFLWSPYYDSYDYLSSEEPHDQFAEIWEMMVADIDRMNSDYTPGFYYNQYSCASFTIPCEYSNYCRTRTWNGKEQAQGVLDTQFIRLEKK